MSGQTMLLGALLSTAAACTAVAAAAPGEPPPMYTMVELDSIGSSANSLAMAISDPTPAGPVIVGQSFSTFSPPTLSWRAVAWRPDVSLAPIDLLTIAQAGNGTTSRAQDVSPNGACIVGLSSFSVGGGLRWSFDPLRGTVTGTQSLSPLPGDGSEGVGVNSAGRATGYSMSDTSTTRAVTWAPDSSTAALLETPPGSGGFRLAREISEAPLEHIVGRCDMSSAPTTRPIIWKKSDGAYQAGEILDLLSPMHVHDAMGISPDGSVAVGFGVSLAGESVGVAWDPLTSDAVGYDPLCCSQNVIFDINNDGVAVGYTGITFQIFRAVLWWEGVPYDLNSRIVNNPEIGDSTFLHVATGVNSAGQIVGTFGGFGSKEPLAPGRVFMLTPAPTAIPGDLNGDGTVDGADVGILLGAWGTPDADLNSDGTTDGADLGVLLGAWSE